MTAPRLDLVAAVTQALAEAADPAAAAPMQQYMKSAMPYYGVRMPATRRLVKTVLDAHRLDGRAVWEATARAMFDRATHREERYAALALLAHRYYRDFATPATLKLLEHLIRTGAWWDLVDETSHRVGDLLLRFRADVEPVVRQWATSEDVWIRRSSIICQVGHRDRTDLDLLAATIEPNLGDVDFFIRKAIGWSLREVAYLEPEWVWWFVSAHEGRLSPLSRREGLKHIGPPPALL